MTKLGHLEPVKYRVFCETHKRWEFYTLGGLICGEATSANGEGEFDGKTWGRYIGRVDANGKEVYQGDIVVFHKGYADDTWTDTENGKPYVITWEEDSLSFRAIRDRFSLTPLHQYQGTRYPWRWEVIGNVHENPELINK